MRWSSAVRFKFLFLMSRQKPAWPSDGAASRRTITQSAVLLCSQRVMKWLQHRRLILFAQTRFCSEETEQRGDVKHYPPV